MEPYKVPLRDITRLPDNPKKYEIIQNKYWAIDKKNNVFFIENRPICGITKQSLSFYIRNLKLPLNAHAYGKKRNLFDMIYLETAWIKK